MPDPKQGFIPATAVRTAGCKGPLTIAKFNRHEKPGRTAKLIWRRASTAHCTAGVAALLNHPANLVSFIGFCERGYFCPSKGLVHGDHWLLYGPAKLRPSL